MSTFHVVTALNVWLCQHDIWHLLPYKTLFVRLASLDYSKSCLEKQKVENADTEKSIDADRLLIVIQFQMTHWQSCVCNCTGRLLNGITISHKKKCRIQSTPLSFSTKLVEHTPPPCSNNPLLYCLTETSNLNTPDFFFHKDPSLIPWEINKNVRQLKKVRKKILAQHQRLIGPILWTDTDLPSKFCGNQFCSC